jgi:uncharacterized protein (TIGR03083 family)
MTTLEMIAARRRTLADQLATLSRAQWEASSLCDAWTVREVVGHVVMPFTHSTVKVLFGVVRARGSWHRFSEQAARENATRPTEELIGLLRDHAEDPWAPPGGGLIGALTDLVVHSLDIARPCGVDPELDEATTRAVLDSVVRPKALKSFGTNLDGLRLQATDLDWSHGDGRLVRGAAEDLLVAITGRAGASLEGDGAQSLERVS